jgi:predicted MFS family arabinose efflux permease
MLGTVMVDEKTGTRQVVRRATGARWLGAGLAACMIGWGTNQFTPLLLLYRARLGLSVPVLDAVFAMYALGLVPGLLAGGSLSDRIGRRRMVVFALITSMIGSAVLIAGTRGTAWLFAGRLIVGLGSGSAFSSGAAWIKELSVPPYGDTTLASAARRASVAMTTGFALGPLATGLLAQWAPMPTTLPYLPQLVLAALAITVAVRTPETVPAGGSGSRWRAPRIPARFARAVLPMAPWVFGSIAVGSVYVPGLVAGRASGLPIVFAAAAAVAGPGGGVLVQPFARGLASRHERRLLATGLVITGAGMLAEAGIVVAPGGWWQPVLALLISAELGAGYGILLVYGLTEVSRLARPEDLAALTGVFQVACYTGFAAPVVLSLLHGVPPATLLLALAALAVLTLALTVWQSRRRREPGPAGRVLV